MAKKRYFRIGEFAKLCNVNKKTLQYYDGEGVFRPDTIGENGYRYYSSRQLYFFQVIKNLREIGLSIQEIKDYLPSRTPASCEKLLREQQIWVRNEIKKYQRMDHILTNQLDLLEDAKEVDFVNITEHMLKARRMVISENVRELTLFEQEQIIQKHENYCMENEFNIGYSYGTMIAASDLLAGDEDFPTYFFTRTDKPLAMIGKQYRHVRPAGRYATVYLHGDYDDHTAACQRLRDYFAEKNLRPIGFAYEESLIDDASAADSKDYITRIAVQVEEKE